ncbi:MAG TPA: OsmC family protein [Bryobacteraceae bacterium]|nr:OsmC family protein [Bryobacteraceae bacterium]
MEVLAEYLGAAKFEVAARGHKLICDQPIDSGGTDEGMSPPELMLASLATCAAYYAAQYLSTRKLPVDGLNVRVTAEKGGQPARLTSFQIHVCTPQLEERHRIGVVRAVKTCLVHNTLLYSPTVDVLLEAGPLQSEAELAIGTDYRN